MDVLDPKTTAMIALDLQKGIISNPFTPHRREDVLANAVELTSKIRNAGGTVVLVNVGWHADYGDAPKQPVDQPMHGLPPGSDWYDFADGLQEAGDLVITKRQWGAFYGTELDLQLRRRGIKTLILCGYATNIAVESTARDGWEHGYNLVFAEDAMASFVADLHQFPVASVFPLIGHVRSTAEILEKIG